MATGQLEGLIKQAQAADIRAKGARSGNVVGQGALTDITGKNEMDNVMLQLQSLSTVLRSSGVNFGHAVANPTSAINAGNAAQITGVSQGIGFDPGKIIPLITATSNATDKAYEMLQQGLHPGTFANDQQEEEFYADYLKKGGQEAKQGMTAKETIQKMTPEELAKLTGAAKENSTVADSISLLSDTNNPFNRSLLASNQMSLAEQEKITAGVASNTKTIDQWLDTINDNLIGWLGKPLSLLVDKFVGGGTVTGAEHNAQLLELQDKTFNQNIDAARQLEAAAEAKGTQWTDVVADKDNNKRSLKELLASYDELSKKVNEGGDVGKTASSQLKTVTEDIRDTVAHATGGYFQGIGPAAQDYYKKQIDDQFKGIGATGLDIGTGKVIPLGGATPPKVDQSAATPAAAGVTGTTPGQGQTGGNVTVNAGTTNVYGAQQQSTPPPPSGKASGENQHYSAAAQQPVVPSPANSVKAVDLSQVQRLAAGR